MSGSLLDIYLSMALGGTVLIYGITFKHGIGLDAQLYYFSKCCLRASFADSSSLPKSQALHPTVEVAFCLCLQKFKALDRLNVLVQLTEGCWRVHILHDVEPMSETFLATRLGRTGRIIIIV